MKYDFEIINIVHKQTLNHLAKLVKWLSCIVSTYLYDTFWLYVLCHICISKWIDILQLSECQETACLKQAQNLTFKWLQLWTQTHNHLVHKQTLNHIAKLASLTGLAKWLSVRLWTKWLWVRVQLHSFFQDFFIPVLSCNETSQHLTPSAPQNSVRYREVSAT